MQNHHIWPTTVSEFHLDFAAEKDAHLAALLAQFNESGEAEESTGALAVHHDPAFVDLYAKITECVRERFESLGMLHEGLDFNIVKSWPNVLTNRPTPMHNHIDAHVSFAYYMNVPEEREQVIRFARPNTEPHPNEPYQGFVDHGVAEYNQFNCATYGVIPKEGCLLVFPSHVNHETLGTAVWKGERESIESLEELRSARVCIAGDIIVTQKKPHPFPTGLQPISQWRTF